MAVYASDWSGFDTNRITAAGGSGGNFGTGGTVWVADGRPPRAYLNGHYEHERSVIMTGFPVLELRTTYPDAHILYTLDGSDPRHGFAYLEPIRLTASVSLRAIAYSDSYTQASEGQALSIVVSVPPSIDQAPSPLRVAEGSPASFRVKADGSGPLAYEWRRDGVSLPGVAGPEFLLPSALSADAGDYSVVVTNTFGSVTSTVARLTVIRPPGFTHQPVGATVPAGSPVTLCAEATGTDPIVFQWRINGLNIEGATSACLTIPSVQFTNSGTYTVVVGNGAGALTSDPALVRVLVPALQPADAFAARVLLPGDSGSVSGANRTATFESGEPLHAGKPGGKSVWYRWVPTASGVATLHTRGSAFDTLLAVYRGSDVSHLAAVGSDEDSGGFLTSWLQLPVTQGVEYAIAIDGYGGESGLLTMNWSLEPTVEVLPLIVDQPVGGAGRLGQEFTFTVKALPATVSYQWLFEGQPLPGATTSSLTVSPVELSRVGRYAVRVTGSPGRVVQSSEALLEVGPQPVVVSYDKFQDLLGAPPPPPPVALRAGPGLASTAPSGGYISIGLGAAGSQIINNAGSGTQIGEPNHCGRLANGRTRYFGLRTETSGVVVLTTAGSSIGTILTVYAWPAGVLWTSLSPIACSEGRTQGDSEVRFATDATPAIPRDFIVVVDSVGPPTPIYNPDGTVAESGLIHLNWNMGTPPSVRTLGGDGLVVEGEDRLLEAVVDGAGVQFDWRQNGTPISGAHTNRLALQGVTPVQAGRYEVVASNVFGSATASLDLGVLSLGGTGRRAQLGQVAALGVTLSQDGACTPSYQWDRNGVALPGETGAVLKFPSTAWTTAGEYGLKIGLCGKTTRVVVERVQVQGAVAIRAKTLHGIGPFRFEGVERAVCFVVVESAANIGDPWELVSRDAVSGPVVEVTLPEPNPGSGGRLYRASLEYCP